MRKLLEAYCYIAHRLWWVPGFGKFPLIACPVSYFTGKEWFERWYWKESLDDGPGLSPWQNNP